MKLLLLACFGLLPYFQQRASIYTISCTMADGRSIPLSRYKGKKMVFVILPQAGDTSFYQGLTAFQKKHVGVANIIALPTLESGYDSIKMHAIAAKINNHSTVTTENMSATKASGQQSPILEWLTQKDKNGHYQVERPVAGHKFFVDEQGTLYAVLGPRLSLTAPIMERIVQRQLPVKPAPVPVP